MYRPANMKIDFRLLPKNVMPSPRRKQGSGNGKNLWIKAFAEMTTGTAVAFSKNTAGWLRQVFTIVLLSAGLLLLMQRLVFAQYALTGASQPETLQMISGKSIVLKTSGPVKRVSIASPEIATYVLLSPREIYITGKSAGSTNLILWQDGDVTGIYDIIVSYDVSEMKHRLHELLPDEKDLRVTTSRDAICLSGRVSCQGNMSQAVSLAKSFAPEGKVNNLMEVAGVQQVMLEVRVAEMQKSLIRRLGVNFTYNNGFDEFGMTTLGGLTEVVAPIDANLAVDGPYGVLVSPAVTGLFRIDSGWTGFVDVLKDQGLVKVLAEPTLIALSGQSANFLAGGEFPVPVPQGLGTVAIEYKPFGVGLSFTPTVLGPDRISLKVAPEVSELDFSTAVRFSGFVIPGLSTRRASTVIELADGQSFAIAGLLRDTVRDQYSKYPILGDIPVLGALFQSRAFQQNETELVIIATPRLVKPIDGDKQPLPTDFYNVPNDADFYLLGNMQGEGEPAGGQPGRFDGEFGHSEPRD